MGKGIDSEDRLDLRRHADQVSVPLLPRGPVMMLRASPRRFCFGPGLHFFIGFLRFGDLFPSLVVSGSVVATIQSECGKAKSGNKETSHKWRNGYRKLSKKVK